MDYRRLRAATSPLVLGLLLVLLVHAAERNRCDKMTELTTEKCTSCLWTLIKPCPTGFKLKSAWSGKPNCKLARVFDLSLGNSLNGCSYVCTKEILMPQCCPGNWGNDCIACPKNAETPCSNNGVCSDGLSGTGTCSCKPGFVGTACENCQENVYGPNCSSVCTCVHGLCNHGIRGDGKCTCFSGYKGMNCDQDIPECRSLQCSQKARCMEDAQTGVMTCRCLPGYQGSGAHCTAIDPCQQNVCDSNAICTMLGPNQHSCSCRNGYQGDGNVCMPVDPCQANSELCPAKSTRCVYDGPGKSHCECKDGFENLLPGIGCSLRDACRPDSCSKNADCSTQAPGVVECTCHQGYLGDGKTCYGNIIQRLHELNMEPGGKWTRQLSNAIMLFESAMSWPLSSLAPFTVFVPINKGFKGTTVNTLVADEMGARYLSKLHVVSGELTLQTLKKGDAFYTLTGKSGEPVDMDGQAKVRIHGSRKKGDILQSDIIASNGVIHIISKLMDSVAPTVRSEKEEDLMKIISDNGKFAKFKNLLERASMARLLEGPGPYTVFAPTNTALDAMKQGHLDYLLSDQGKMKSLELLRNHIIASVQLEVYKVVSSPSSVSMANQVLTFNVSSNGQILVNGQVVLEADVEAKNGRLYSLDGVLIPASIEPVLPHRCDVNESRVYKAPCADCVQMPSNPCPSGVAMGTPVRGCVFREIISQIPLPRFGCWQFCNATAMTARCCKGFYGPDCSPCPGGFTTPCSGHGKCMDGMESNGTCVCEENFKGSRCQYCSRPDKYGPGCDKTCSCIHGQCDSRPESDGACKVDTCQSGYTGKFCERHTQSCGARVEFCHAHAVCEFNGGAVRCVCKPGYQGDGITCVEADPCALPQRGGCSINAKCIKTSPGSHECRCLAGWYADGDDCQAINNCQAPERGGCHPNATCINVGPGQSDCECKSGYRGDGQECEPVNPCVDQNGGCHYMASCRYQYAGVWKCVCDDGYSGDGRLCYSSVAQEMSAIPEGGEFNEWVNNAGLYQMLSETQNLTLLVPSTGAVQKMTEEDKSFWTSPSNLASLVKHHMVKGVYQLADLRNASSSLQLTSFLRGSLPVSRTNGTTIGGGRIISADIAATNGLIHVIDSVLIPNRRLTEGLIELLAQRPEYSMFRSYLIQYNLTQEIESSSAYTVFAPSDSAVSQYLKRTGSTHMDVNTTRYHVILSEKLMARDLQNGLYRETMLGFSFQVGFFLRDGEIHVNEAQLNLTDFQASKGVIHGLSSVLEIQKNRCDFEVPRDIMGSCQECLSNYICPPGTKQMPQMFDQCLTKIFRKFSLGCRYKCRSLIITRRCCGGFFGEHCEPCPGSVEQPCFGNGVCLDGTSGTGTCRCNKGFDGTACENCLPGKYGIHCDQDCVCAHGRCKAGPRGDGTCECDVGWRGVTCDTAIDQDACNGNCHTSANCLTHPDGSWTCKCAAGFEGNGTHCSAKDACSEGNGGCSAVAVCKRTLPGSRDCVCKTGYTGDGLVCVEINPCLEGTADCHENADCVHTGPNMTACTCLRGYSGDGKTCKAINPCRKINGECHHYATCTMTAPGERNCTCREGYVGNGLQCKGIVSKELLTNKNLRDFYFKLMAGNVNDLKGLGPFTVFAPNKEAIRKETNIKQWSSQGFLPQILRYHIVPCRMLTREELSVPRNVTTAHGEVLTITYSQGTIYINDKAKVLSSDDVSLNGVIHEIDTVLIPKVLQTVPADNDGHNGQNLTAVAKQYGYTTFTKLLEDTEVMSLLNDRIHQPVTLFWPSDQAIAALPQEQRDFLFSSHNREMLVEYLKYHIVRDAKVYASGLMHSSLKTLQGSDLSVSCGGEESIGDLFLNGRKCRIVQRQLVFNGGIAHGIDCLLTPPSLGGRCDVTHTADVQGMCGQCSSYMQTCPSGRKLKEVKKCRLPFSILRRTVGCQPVCSLYLWSPKCCPGYFGRDCMACPGGPESPCGNHGKCDEGHLGNGTCTCDPRFQGVACERCLEGHYGPSCQVCNCTEHGSCDEGLKGTGTCFCDKGWTGQRCESKLAVEPVCSPACSQNGVCKENNTCKCRPFYNGDGITCTVVDLCKWQNGGCAKGAKCTQKGEKITCTCPKGHSGDGYVCMPVNLCAAADNGGCHQHATCTMTGPAKRKCECKSDYIGDGVACETRELPVNRCAQGNGQCHPDALCTDLHYEDKTMGVFHKRSTKGQYKLTYAEAREICREEGGTIASFVQLSYAQEAGFNLCAASWLDESRVAYPTTFPNSKCGFGHVGIVDYGTRVNQSETWDVFCYRMKDVSCDCKPGYIGDGYSCSGHLMQVLAAKPNFSNFLSQILNYSSNSDKGKEFVNRLSNLTIQSTLFVPDNSGLDENQTLSGRDIEYHLSDSSALYFQDLTNGSQIRTRLGYNLRVLGIADFHNPDVLTTSRYINDRFLIDWDILASNGIIHILQGPLRAPPPKSTFHAGHKAGMVIGVLLAVLLMGATGFGGYHFYSTQTKPFQFHYFKDDEGNDTGPVESDPSICNPMYDSGSCPSISGLSGEDKHRVVDGGPYDIFQEG